MRRLPGAAAFLVLLVLLALGLLRFGQGPSAGRGWRGENGALQGDTLRLKHARNFRLVDFGDYKVLSTLRPWKDAERSYTMVLAESDTLVPEELQVHPFVRIPARRVVVRSAAQLRAMEALGEIPAVVGIGDLREGSIDEVAVRVRRGLVREVGGDAAFDEEIAWSLNPDVLFTWATGSEMDGQDRLLDLKIPVALEAAWMEETPLGRAEWIRFYAAFFGKDSVAAAFFSGIESDYYDLKTLAAGASNRPKVMTGAPFSGVWSTPGTRTWVAHLIEDAGGTNLWRDDSSAGSAPRTFEAVYARCADADVWINGSDSWNSLDDVRKEDPRFALFKPVRQRTLWNSNASRNGSGANTFWEETPLRPDLLLADLVHVLHPELLLDHQPRWYRRLP